MTALALLLAAYFMPTLVAVLRQHHLTILVALVNGLAGWTVVGWLFALFYACLSDPQPKESFRAKLHHPAPRRRHAPARR